MGVLMQALMKKAMYDQGLLDDQDEEAKKEEEETRYRALAPKMFAGLLADPSMSEADLAKADATSDDPRMNAAYQAMQKAQFAMMTSGLEDARKAMLSNWGNTYNSTVPRAVAPTDDQREFQQAQNDPAFAQYMQQNKLPAALQIAQALPGGINERNIMRAIKSDPTTAMDMATGKAMGQGAADLYYKPQIAQQTAQGEAQVKQNTIGQIAANEAAGKAQVDSVVQPQIAGDKKKAELAAADDAEKMAEKKQYGRIDELLNSPINVNGLAIPIEDALDMSTGSGVGHVIDQGAAMIGKSTPGAIAAAALDPIHKSLVRYVPRFSGPQSDADVKYYNEAAGQLSDPTVPAGIKKQYLYGLRSLAKKYGADAFEPITDARQSGQVSSPSQPREGQMQRNKAGKIRVFQNGQWVYQ